MSNQRTCTVDKCERKHYGNGYCWMHYIRLRRGQPVGSAESVKTGGTKHPLYSTWVNVKTRCNNPKSTSYNYYGARGVKVCERWNNFALFLEDMGEKPSPRHSLDRIDVNGDYEPSNCRWTDWHTQAANRRNSSDSVGVSWDKKGRVWIAFLMVNKKPVLHKQFKTKSDAIKARKKAELSFL
jgi:hypothetical protein